VNTKLLKHKYIGNVYLNCYVYYIGLNGLLTNIYVSLPYLLYKFEIKWFN